MLLTAPPLPTMPIPPTGPSPEDCEIVPLSYRPTRSVIRRQRRIVAAAARLARRRRATYLQDWFLDGAAADHGATRGRPTSH